MMLVFTFCIAQTQRWKLPVSPPLWQFIYLTFSESDVVSLSGMNNFYTWFYTFWIGL